MNGEPALWEHVQRDSRSFGITVRAMVLSLIREAYLK